MRRARTIGRARGQTRLGPVSTPQHTVEELAVQISGASAADATTGP